LKENIRHPEHIVKYTEEAAINICTFLPLSLFHLSETSKIEDI